MHPEPAVALLRGINVGGKNLLPMQALAEIFAAAGATHVETYIQSGNVVFRASRPDVVAATVRSQIAARFGLQVPVVVRSAKEIAVVLTANPFLADEPDISWLHVMFLEDTPPPALIAALDPQRSPPDRFAVRGRDVYLHLPNGAAKTKLTNAWFDSKLKTVSTQRNWKTVLALAAMMES
jgi:uncharacterized protein (DUF1697 family)